MQPSVSSPAQRVLKGCQTSFATQMRRLMGDRDSSDVSFLVGASRKAFSAHQCILSTRCEVFKAMFAEARSQRTPPAGQAGLETERRPLVLTETNPETFAALLEFVYTNCVTLKSSNALDVLAAAVEFSLDDLRRLCFEFLTENLNATNACELLQAALTFGQEELRTRTIEFIEKNASGVFKTRAFSSLSADALAALLASDGLMLDELDVVAALRVWANTAVEATSPGRRGLGSSNRDSDGLAGALRQLRLGLLSPEELAEVEKENQKEALIPVEMFAEAWKLLALRRPTDLRSTISRPRRGTLKRPGREFLIPATSSSRDIP